MRGVIVLCFIGSVLAELPRLQPARCRLQAQELAPTTTDSPTESTTDVTGPYPPSGCKPSGEPFTLTDTCDPPAPYPPSGWKPAGQAFTLPQEQTTSMPDDTYGPPAPYPPSGWKPEGQTFTLPQEETSTPDNTYGPPENTYGAPDANTEKLDGPVEVKRCIGTYYVLLPNGKLHQVEVLTDNDIQNMKYTVKFLDYNMFELIYNILFFSCVMFLAYGLCNVSLKKLFI